MMKLTIDVQVKPKKYNLYIGYDLLDEIVQTIIEKQYGAKYAIITDAAVRPLIGERLLQKMLSRGLDTMIFDFPAGEIHKTRSTKDTLDDYLLQNHFGRDSAIIALGGGVVGDVAGFVASTYMRGIPYIQIPTTVISQGDSSIGGKTAVDVPQGKNLIGSFCTPAASFIDIQFLESLDERNYRSGLVEIIKHSFIKSQELHSFIVENLQTILSRPAINDQNVLVELMRRNCAIKNEVVAADETEKDLRKILNYGHTVGHAVETLSDYSLLHGEAVAIGIACEAFFAYKLGYCTEDTFLTQLDLIKRLHLPYKIPASIALADLISSMRLDKKARNREPEFTFLAELGKVKLFDGKTTTKIAADQLSAMLQEFKLQVL